MSGSSSFQVKSSSSSYINPIYALLSSKRLIENMGGKSQLTSPGRKFRATCVLSNIRALVPQSVVYPTPASGVISTPLSCFTMAVRGARAAMRIGVQVMLRITTGPDHKAFGLKSINLDALVCRIPTTTHRAGKRALGE